MNVMTILKNFLITSILLTVSQVTLAELVPEKKPITGHRSSLDQNKIAGETDIVVPKIEPMVTNILPWKEDRELPQKIRMHSILNSDFEPVDRTSLSSNSAYLETLSTQ